MIEENDLSKVKSLIEILNKAKFEEIAMTDVVLLTRSIEWLGKEYMTSVQHHEKMKNYTPPAPAEDKFKEDMAKAKKKAEENAASRKKSKKKVSKKKASK